MTFDVRERLPESDGAFVGTFLARNDPPPVNGLVSSATQVPYRYQVERVVKGDLPSSGIIEVWSSASGASCGLETLGGERAGLLLEREGDRWTSNLCSQADPDALLRAGQPLPPPPGKAPPAVLVGTTHGPGRMLSLDGLGRVVAYGPGAGTVTDFAFCPGAAWLAEAYTAPGEHSYYRPGVAIRSTTDLAVAWERFLATDEQRYAALADVACLQQGPDTAEVLALVIEDTYTDTRTRHDGRILAFGRDGAPRLLWQGEAADGTFSVDGRMVFVNGGTDGRDLLHVDLTDPAHPKVQTLLQLPAGTGPLAIAPGGRHLAGATSHRSWTGAGSPPPTKAVVVDLAASPPAVTEADLGPYGRYTTALWSSPDQIVFTPGWNDQPVRLFDPTLEDAGSWPGWGASHVAVVGERLVGLAGPKVISAPVATGPASEWADLESGVPGTIAAFPGGAGIGTAGPPSTTTSAPRTPKTAAERPSSTTTVPVAAPEPGPGDDVVAMPENAGGGGTGGRPILAGGAGAALLAAGAAGLIRRRRMPKLPQL
jgi:hypothetical protein